MHCMLRHHSMHAAPTWQLLTLAVWCSLMQQPTCNAASGLSCGTVDGTCTCLATSSTPICDAGTCKVRCPLSI